MNGREYWDFLDEWKPNLLYQYAEGSGYKFNPIYLTSSQNAYYLMWFVYRYVLNCTTLDEALEHANVSTMQEYNLIRIVNNLSYQDKTSASLINFGTEQFGKVEISSPRSASDNKKIVKCICIILEVLYNRYNYLEQLECCIKHFGRANAPASRQAAIVIQAKEIIRNSIEYMRKHPKYEGLLLQHRQTRKEILGDCYYEL